MIFFFLVLVFFFRGFILRNILKLLTMLVEKKVVAAIPEIVVEHESKLLYVLITPVFATFHY